jgi:hypothetical protein
MRSSGIIVRIAGTIEHALMVVGGDCVVQGEVGSRVAHRLRGKTVEEVCGGVQGLCQVAGRERRLEEKAMSCTAAPTSGNGVPVTYGVRVSALNTPKRQQPQVPLDKISASSRSGRRNSCSC